ncbi:hypothetical protein ACFRAE_12865 [Sphingobacterium sp. HJSM2_6]|uniref:hypothetical protein n=1 Tax=Sphingobacterium sp. HJSM2_6 TaxID=3366264 RepID=UPI003BE2BCA0
MKKLIFVEEIDICRLNFKGFVIEREDRALSYAIYIADFDFPLFEMYHDEDYNVHFSFNDLIVEYINNHKTADQKQRMLNFRSFYQFVLHSEKKASYMIFKNKKVNYIKNSSKIKELRSLYLYK